MPGGRPTKLTPELIAQAEKHVASMDVSVHTLLPTIEGLALELRISRDTLYEWEKESEEFSDILNELRARQAQKLMQNSLMGRYNPTIAKLILSGKHGYVEKQEQDITSGGKSISPVLVEFVGEGHETKPDDTNTN